MNGSKILRNIGMAILVFCIAIAVMSVDPYTECVLSTEEFLKRIFWCVICGFAGYELTMNKRRKVDWEK